MDDKIDYETPPGEIAEERILKNAAEAHEAIASPFTSTSSRIGFADPSGLVTYFEPRHCLTAELELRKEVLFKLLEMDKAGYVMDINLAIEDAKVVVDFILGKQEESPATGPEQSQLETSGFDPAWRKKWDDANGNKRPAECDPPIPPSE